MEEWSQNQPPLPAPSSFCGIRAGGGQRPAGQREARQLPQNVLLASPALLPVWPGGGMPAEPGSLRWLWGCGGQGRCALCSVASGAQVFRDWQTHGCPGCLGERQSLHQFVVVCVTPLG